MRHDPATAAVVVMLRILKMNGMVQAVDELLDQVARAFNTAVLQGKRRGAQNTKGKARHLTIPQRGKLSSNRVSWPSTPEWRCQCSMSIKNRAHIITRIPIIGQMVSRKPLARGMIRCHQSTLAFCRFQRGCQNQAYAK